MIVNTRLQASKAQTVRRGSFEMSPKIQESAQLQTMFEEMFKNFQREIKQELKDHRKEVNDSLDKGHDKLEKTLEEFSKELTTIKSDVATNKNKISKLEDSTKHLEDQQKSSGNLILMHELRYREKCLKFRGLGETVNENLYNKIIPSLAEFMDTSEEYLEMEIDKIFRINSEVAKDKGFPRDIIICFARSKVRDELLQRSYENSLQIGDSKIKIFKDIPAIILRKRQEYKQLTQILNANNIRYSWDRVDGVIFNYKQRRFRINNPLKAEEFIRKFKKDREKDQENKELKGNS